MGGNRPQFAVLKLVWTPEIGAEMRSNQLELSGKKSVESHYSSDRNDTLKKKMLSPCVPKMDF